MHPKALAYQQEGLAFKERGEWAAARDAFLAALELDARYDEARYELAQALAALGDLAGAATHSQTLLDNQPNHLGAALLLGTSLRKLGRRGEAIGALQRVLFIDSSHQLALEELVAVYRESGQTAGELDALQRLVALDPKNAAIRVTLAELLLKAGRSGEAAAPLRDALALDPGAIHAYLLLAEIEGREGRGEEAWRILQSVAGRAPDTPGLRIALQSLCRRQAAEATQANQTSSAIQWWERLLAFAPDDPEALSRLERLYTSQSRMGDLVGLLEQFSARHPDDAPAVIKLADAMLALGRKADALMVYTRVLHTTPDDEALRNKAVEVAMELNQPQTARQLMLIGRDLTTLPAEERLRYARAKALEGQREEAWSLFESLLDDPEHGETARTLARNLAVRQAEDHSQNPMQALKWWERALIVNPQDENAARMAAILYRQSDRGADAVRVLRVLPNRYKDPDILKEFAAACDLAQLHDEAHEAYTALAAREGDTVEGLLHLIGLSLAAGKPDRAWKECERLGRNFPDSPRIRPAQARVAAATATSLEADGKYAEAVTWWKQHLTFDPDSMDRKRLALAQIATGDLNGAMLTYRSWFRRHPTDIEVALWLGNNELEEGLFSEAREYFEAVIELRPNNLEALHGLAKVAAGEGNDDEALRLFSRILALEKDHIPSALVMARDLSEKGDDDQAWAFLQRVLNQNPDHEEAKALALPVLKKLARGYEGEFATAWWEQVLSIAPEDPDALKALARNVVEQVDATPAERIEAHTQVLAADPTDVESRLFLAEQACDAGRIDEARRLLATPGILLTPGGILLVARIALADGDVNRARNLFRQVLKDHPNDARALLGQAELAMAEKRPQEAWSLLSTLPKDVTDWPKTRDLMGRVARRLAETATGVAAIPIFEELLRVCPDDLEARFTLAEIHADDDNELQAVVYLQEVLDLDPANERAAFAVVDLLEKGGQLVPAIKALAPLVAAGNTTAVLRTARLHVKAGNRALARAAFEQIVAAENAHEEAREALADLSAAEADGQSTWRHLQVLLVAKPEERGLRLSIYRKLRELAERLDPEEALAWWPEVVAFDPHDLDLQITHATLLRAAGRPGEAADALGRVLDRAPYRLDLALELGQYHLAEGRLDRARSTFGIAAQGGDTGAFIALGDISKQEGDAPQAAGWYAKALAQRPEDPALLWNLAECHFEAGTPREARSALETLLALQPDHPRAKPMLVTVLRDVARSAEGPEALHVWRQLSEADATDLEAHRETLRLATEQGDERTAEEALERLSASDPSDGRSAFTFAVRLHAQGRFEEALPLLERAYSHGLTEAGWFLADLAHRQGRDDDARQWLQRSEADGSTDPRLSRLAYELARGAEDVEGMWAALGALAERTSDDPFSRTQRLELCRHELERAPDSLLWIERAYALSPAPGEVPATAIAHLAAHYAANDRQDEAEAAYTWAAQAGESRALVALAQRARARGDWEAAVAHGRAAVQALPGDEDRVVELAEALLRTSRPSEAYELLSEQVRVRPAMARARGLLLTCVRALAEGATGEAALERYRELVRLDPSDLAGWRAIARLATELDRPAERARALEQIVFLDPSDVAGARDLGLRWLAAGRGAEALKLFERAVQAGDSERVPDAVTAALIARDAERAAHWLAQLRRDLPGRETMELALARLREDPEATWTALLALDRVITPSDNPVLRSLKLGHCWAQIEAGPAEAWLSRALSLAPSDEELPPVAHVQLGRTQLAEGRIAEARNHFTLAATQGDPVAMAELARLERSEGMFAEALMWFARARKGHDDPAVAVDHAETLAQMGQLAESASMLEELIGSGHADPQARKLLVDVLRSLAFEATGAEALAAWKRVAAVAPDDAEALRQIVLLAHGLSRDDETLEALERLVAANPEDGASAFALAQQRLAAGEKEAARTLYLQAARTDLAAAYLPLAELSLEVQDWATARHWLDKHAEVVPDDVALWRARRTLAEATGDGEAHWMALDCLSLMDPSAESLDEERRALCARMLAGAQGPEALVWLERSSQLAPDDPQLALSVAEALQQAGKEAESAAAYRRAYELGARHPNLFRALHAAASQQGDFAAAFQWARALWELTPGDLEPRSLAVAAARRAAEAASGGAAASWWRQVIELAPHDPAAVRKLIAALREEGDYAQAADWCQRLLELVPGDLEAATVLAEREMARGDHPAARRALEQLLSAHGQHVPSLLVLARLEREEGRTDRALAALDRAIAADPTHLEARMTRSDLLWAIGRAEEAYEELEQAMQHDASAAVTPVALPRAIELAERAEADGRTAEAYGWWHRVLAHDPDHREAHRAIARALVAAGRPEEALSHGFALVKSDPAADDLELLARTLLMARRRVEATAILQSLARDYDHVPAMILLAQLQLQDGHLDEAWSVAQALMERDAPGADDLASEIASVRARAIDPLVDAEASMEAWHAVLTFKPGDPGALFGMARAHLAAGDVEDATELLRELLDERPDWLDAKALLAECLLKSGDAATAEAMFHEVLARDPSHPVVLMALARSAQSRGEFVMAGDYAQRVLALGDTPEADRARRLAAYCARQLAEAARLRRDFDQAFLYADLLFAYQAQTLDLLRFGAELARDAGRMAIAASRYRRLIVAYPDALEEGLQLSRCYPDPSEARKALTGLWQETRAIASAHALAVMASDETPEEAIAWWDRALEVAPEHPVLLRRVADLCRREDRDEDACQYYRRLAAVTGNEPALLKVWGATALHGELYYEAREPFELLANEYGDRQAAFTLATVWERLGDDGMAWACALRVLAEADHSEAERLAETCARRLAMNTPTEESVDWWQRYLDLAPADVEAWVELAKAQFTLENGEAALASLDRALELAPAHLGALEQRAHVLRELGRLDEAIRTCEEALREDPRHVPSLLTLAELAWDSGDLQAVWDLGQQLLQIDNRNATAIDLIGRCARLLAQEATAAGDWDNAILYWELLLSFASDERGALESLGEAYTQAGRFAEAVGIQRERVRLDPDDPTVKFRLGEIAAMGGFWDEARQVFTELREADPQHLPTHHALALVALGLMEPMAAVEHYRDALAIAPDDLAALVGMGQILLAEGQLAEAWDPLRKAVDLASDGQERMEAVALARSVADKLAEQAASKQRWDEAIAFRHEAVRLEPEDPNAHRQLARTFHAAGRKAEAIGELSALLKANPQDYDAAYLLGDIHRQSGDLDGARRIFASITDQDPRHLEARVAQAEIAWEASELEPAWNHLQQALAVDPDHPEALKLYRLIALAFAERSMVSSDFAGAIQWWQLAWEQDRSDVELLRKIAQAQVTIGHLSGAAETYAKLLDADPKDLETAHILADIHRQRGDLKSAEGPLLRIVALDPRHVPSLRALVILARDRQNPPEALKRAYDLLDVEPRNTEALMLLAWAHEQMMERRAALEVCKDIVAIDPQHAEAHHTMGRLARDLGDLALAKKALTSAIYFQPKAAYYHTMGTIYEGLGQIEEALAAYSQALVLDPDNAEAHADLGLGLMRQAQPEKAKPHLMRAFAMFPPESDRALALQCALDLIG